MAPSSSGLGYRLLTPATRVRLPLGLRIWIKPLKVMTTSYLIRQSFGICGAVFALAACGTAQMPLAAPHGILQSHAQSNARYKVLYQFRGGQDGAEPAGDLIYVNGTLYGTTQVGGASGNGTVFALNPSTGRERVIANFVGNPANGPLLYVGQSLYGTGLTGGASYAGNVFEVNLVTGKTSWMCALRGKNGRNPNLGLIESNGVLYGTAAGGGAYLLGTVFACDASTKKSRRVYSFKAGPSGADPLAGLIAVNGEFYGTTYGAGTYYYGTLFKANGAGKHQVLHAFTNYPDGAWPRAKLIKVNSTFYGTTVGGGAYEKGTVFKTSTSGRVTVLYSFKGPPDGYEPAASVTYVNGSLYGTTQYGGEPSSGCDCGTVFQLSASGRESVLHRFTGGGDGSWPLSKLVNVKGTLFGTTAGFSSQCNPSQLGECGTVFEITP